MLLVSLYPHACLLFKSLLSLGGSSYPLFIDATGLSSLHMRFSITYQGHFYILGNHLLEILIQIWVLTDYYAATQLEYLKRHLSIIYPPEKLIFCNEWLHYMHDYKQSMPTDLYAFCVWCECMCAVGSVREWCLLRLHCETVVKHIISIQACLPFNFSKFWSIRTYHFDVIQIKVNDIQSTQAYWYKIWYLRPFLPCILLNVDKELENQGTV